MRKLVAVVAGLLLSAAALPMYGQTFDMRTHFNHPPVKVMPGPQNPNNLGIVPTLFRSAYGFNNIPNLGQGQTIAIIDAYDDPNIASDLAYYANYFHIGPCNFQKVNLGTMQGQAWDLEESLDVEQACAIAPRSNIILFEAASSSDTDLYAAVQMATQAPYNATVVSMSWGEKEFSSETQLDSYFCNIINSLGQPVTFFAASGDGAHGTNYPSASRCVIAAGGTILTLSTDQPGPTPLTIDYGSETAWHDSSGGLSAYESQPSWQNPACAAWSTTQRCVPDLASVAQAIPVYDTYSYYGWVVTEGTSISSPDWAAFLTLVNSGRVLAGKGQLSQAAYDLYQAYYSSNYNADFHDITTGNNGDCGSQCNATTGYDLVTGIGTYQANNLYRALLAVPN
jgi:subtilase family serine protease